MDATDKKPPAHKTITPSEVPTIVGHDFGRDPTTILYEASATHTCSNRRGGYRCDVCFKRLVF